MSAAWRAAARARWRSARKGERPELMRAWLTRQSIARRRTAGEAWRAPAPRQRAEASAVGDATAGLTFGTPGSATGGTMVAAAVAGTAARTLPTSRNVELRATNRRFRALESMRDSPWVRVLLIESGADTPVGPFSLEQACLYPDQPHPSPDFSRWYTRPRDRRPV